MKPLFCNSFVKFLLSSIIAAMLILLSLPGESYGQDKPTPFNKNKKPKETKKIEDFFKEDGSPGLDIKKLQEYLKTNPDGLEELEIPNPKGTINSPTESITGNGFLLSEDLNQWAGGGGTTYGNNHRWGYTYDTNNNLTEVLQQHWWAPGMWYDLYRDTCSYDAKNNRIDSLFQIWDWDNFVWDNWLKWVNTYDANNNRIKQIYQTWIPDESNWMTQSSGTTENLNAVSVIDAYTSFTVGNGGKILRTTNGGQNWITQVSGTTVALNDVNFINVVIGWVVGDNGAILKTLNGGTTWTSETSGTSSQLTGVSFVDSLKGTAIGTSGTILRTTNGGQNWIIQSSGTTVKLNDVCFKDVNTGWVVGDNGTILKTTNGGTTWSSEISGTTINLKWRPLSQFKYRICCW